MWLPRSIPIEIGVNRLARTHVGDQAVTRRRRKEACRTRKEEDEGAAARSRRREAGGGGGGGGDVGEAGMLCVAELVAVVVVARPVCCKERGLREV